ncbi:MAG: endonuclease, partial [Bacilli bacterium]|nr:endonuclease [Bacilli bacterium]
MLLKKNKIQKLFLSFSLLLVGVFTLVSCEPSVDPTTTDPTITDPTTSDPTTDSTEPDEDIVYHDYYNGYYENLTSWENGEDLKTQLYQIVNKNVSFVNFDTSSQKWEVNQLADETFDNLDRVNLVYASYQPLKTYTSTSSNNGWQREHAFCQTLGNFHEGNDRPDTEQELVKQMRSDFHNLFASDKRINNSRGNKNLGNVDESMGTVVYPTDVHGNVTGVRAIESVGDESVSIFEPREEEKAMLARAIFYMATRFEDLNVVEGISGTGCKSHGMLVDLLLWSTDDVSLREYKHNIGVYSFQNNRNPYVDYPELVD